MKNFIRRNYRFLAIWLGLTFIFFSVAGLVYGVAQQMIRIDANDQQIQLAQELNNAVVNGKDISSYFQNGGIDISKSLYPFVIQYDKDMKVVESDSTLDGATPELPAGVLNNVPADYFKIFTWEPKKGVRVASVVIKNNTGYLLSGKSLRQAESKITRIGKIVLLWLALVELFVTLALLLNRHRKHVANKIRNLKSIKLPKRARKVAM